MWKPVCGAVLVCVAIQPKSAPWRLSQTPTLSIGTLDGPSPTQLSRVYGALRLADGRMIVGNSESGELRFFDARGAFVRTAGRRGAGPGEFDGSSLVPRLFDTSQLLVEDAGNRRVNVFGVDGRFLRTFRMEPPASEGSANIAAVAGRELVGFTLRNARLQGAPGTRLDATYAYAMFDTLGRPQRALFEAAGRARLVHTYQLITHYPFIPFSTDALVAAAGDRVYLLRNDAPEIEVWSTSGQRVTTFRWTATRTDVRLIWARFKQAELATMTRERDKLLYGHFYDMDLPLPQYVPVASQLRVAPDGALWVERYRLPWDERRLWDVLSPVGKFLGTVEMPGRFDVYQVGADFVMGRLRDEDGLEQVHVYGLRRP